jgi:soluble lytic murein transglycosylase-like protein
MTAYLSGLPQDRKQVARLIRRLAPVYRVDPHLALAIASAESNFNSHAVSPKMAMGVMQLIPATAERFNVRQPFDAEQNIRGGLAYLRWLHQRFGGDIVRIVAAYNAGEGAVTQYNGVPPYRETQTYVVRVLSFAGRSACGAARPGQPGQPDGGC